MREIKALGWYLRLEQPVPLASRVYKEDSVRGEKNGTLRRRWLMSYLGNAEE